MPCLVGDLVTTVPKGVYISVLKIILVSIMFYGCGFCVDQKVTPIDTSRVENLIKMPTP
jgi:predicted DNA-binding helix-hairpin-helix protein